MGGGVHFLVQVRGSVCGLQGAARVDVFGLLQCPLLVNFHAKID